MPGSLEHAPERLGRALRGPILAPPGPAPAAADAEKNFGIILVRINGRR